MDGWMDGWISVWTENLKIFIAFFSKIISQANHGD
jgi:hypothetical protein